MLNATPSRADIEAVQIEINQQRSDAMSANPPPSVPEERAYREQAALARRPSILQLHAVGVFLPEGI